jgi:hypothetical protein
VAASTDPAAPRRAYVVTLEFDGGGGTRTRIERSLLRTRGGRSLDPGTAVDVANPRGQPARAELLHGLAAWVGGYTAIFVGALLIAVTFAGRSRAPAM